MKRRQGQLAATLFCALSAGGILTLFSQARENGDPPVPTRAMNLSSPEGQVFQEVLPAAIKSGTLSPEAAREGEKPAEKRKAPARLTLR